jgi:AcrR family transcriptional regulator
MSAADRRQHLLDVGSRVFAQSGFRSATTAQIAREAGVSEPVLYQHFANKRDLYLACVDMQWQRMLERWEAAISEQPDPALWTIAIAQSMFAPGDDVVVQLWPQALSETSTDGEVQAYFAAHLAQIHDYIADVYRRSQEAGGIRAGRDPAAEAWIFLAIGILRSADERIGNIVGPHFAQIVDSRRRWLSGDDAEQ